MLCIPWALEEYYLTVHWENALHGQINFCASTPGAADLLLIMIWMLGIHLN